jgi:hypothetical protein
LRSGSVMFRRIDFANATWRAEVFIRLITPL